MRRGFTDAVISLLAQAREKVVMSSFLLVDKWVEDAIHQTAARGVRVYNLLDGSGLPHATTYGRGIYTDDIFWWVTKVSSGGDKDYEIHVFNNAPTVLWISIAAYARD